MEAILACVSSVDRVPTTSTPSHGDVDGKIGNFGAVAETNQSEREDAYTVYIGIYMYI